MKRRRVTVPKKKIHGKNNFCPLNIIRVSFCLLFSLFFTVYYARSSSKSNSMGGNACFFLSHCLLLRVRYSLRPSNSYFMCLQKTRPFCRLRTPKYGCTIDPESIGLEKPAPSPSQMTLPLPYFFLLILCALSNPFELIISFGFI